MDRLWLDGIWSLWCSRLKYKSSEDDLLFLYHIPYHNNYIHCKNDNLMSFLSKADFKTK